MNTTNTQTNEQWSKLFKGALKPKVNHLKRLEVTSQLGEILDQILKVKILTTVAD